MVPVRHFVGHFVGHFVVLLGLGACTSGDEAPHDTEVDDTEVVDTEVADAPAWGDGPRAIRGRAWFFDMPSVPDLVVEDDVEGAEVYVLEAPAIRATVHPDDDYAYELTGIPDGVGVTLAVSHPDHYPTLSATLPVDGADLEHVEFQIVTHTIAGLLAGVLGADVDDPTTCHMVTTVTAPDPVDVWAPGQPDATVTIDPPVPEEQGPVYFDGHVIPDRSLTTTSGDGGVIVAGAAPGTYAWTGHADGVAFTTLTMPCVAGWLTNAAPPWGMNATITGP